MPLLPEEMRTDPMEELRASVEWDLMLAKEEENPDEIKEFELALKIVAEMEAEEKQNSPKEA
jgi:hypothetical protein